MTKVRIATTFPRPTVYLDRQSYEDMVMVANATRDEVAWFCQVTEFPDDVFLIHDVFVPHQESSGATVEIQPDILASFAEEYLDKYGIEGFNRLHCWGHSHHTMGVTPSSQDQSTVDKLCDAIGQRFFAIRTNHRGDIEVDVAYPNGITLEDVDTYIGVPDQNKEAEWQALVKERVSRITYKVSAYAGGKGQGKGKGKAHGAQAPQLPANATGMGFADDDWDQGAKEFNGDVFAGDGMYYSATQKRYVKHHELTHFDLLALEDDEDSVDAMSAHMQRWGF